MLIAQTASPSISFREAMISRAVILGKTAGEVT
jgi:hypothetical protein